MTTRLIMVEIDGVDQRQVELLANLLEDQLKVIAAFAQNMVEEYADQGRTADDPPANVPKVNVTNTLVEQN